MKAFHADTVTVDGHAEVLPSNRFTTFRRRRHLSRAAFGMKGPENTHGSSSLIVEFCVWLPWPALMKDTLASLYSGADA